MNLVEKAKSKVSDRKASLNKYSDEEWALAKALISKEVTLRQCMFALGRGGHASTVYPWLVKMITEAFSKGLIEFK